MLLTTNEDFYKRVHRTGRGVGGMVTLPELRDAYAENFGGESETPYGWETLSLRRNILNVQTHSVVRPVGPSGQIVKNVMRDAGSTGS
jgi:hypothetical protein